MKTSKGSRSFFILIYKGVVCRYHFFLLFKSLGPMGQVLFIRIEFTGPRTPKVFTSDRMATK